MYEIKMRGIDVSRWQGDIDFARVKRSGIDFVMIKAGGSDGLRYTDSYFARNYEAAIRADLHVGAYYYMGKTSVNLYVGLEDARHFASIIGDRVFDMPIALDVEAQPANMRNMVTEAVIYAADKLEGMHYYVSVYGSRVGTFIDRVVDDRLGHLDHWVADYRDYTCNNPHAYIRNHAGIWQYSDRAHVDGIIGNVDVDVAYKDYPSIIKNAGLNHFVKPKK